MIRLRFRNRFNGGRSNWFISKAGSGFALWSLEGIVQYLRQRWVLFCGRRRDYRGKRWRGRLLLVFFPKHRREACWRDVAWLDGFTNRAGSR